MNEALDNFFARTDLSSIASANNWEFKRNPENEDIFRFYFPASDGQRYIARLECSDLDEQAPSVMFINEEGLKDDAKAWPVGDSAFHEIVKVPSNCFLCMPLTREGLQHHAEWVGTASSWGAGRKTILDVLNFLSRWLNSSHYTGRGPK